MNVSLYRFNLPLRKTRRVIKSEIRAAVIKVMGAIKRKGRKNLYQNLPLHLPPSAAWSMQHEGKTLLYVSSKGGLMHPCLSWTF